MQRFCILGIFMPKVRMLGVPVIAAMAVAMLGGLLPGTDAQAQAKTQFIVNGVPAGGTDENGAALQIGADQKLMLEAAKKVVSNDYKGAEALYNQAISLNNNNIDAYLQRGIVRRELGDEAGAEADGRTVVAMANTSLQQRPNDAMLYHRRGMGLRLLKDFAQAKADISKAIQMSGQLSWQTDLQAIELEQKVYQ